MKKFLSLVLAMIMTLSLVTISAGATEYKDLTDKDEIKYEEAVAVLNRIGVITGYDDGTFRPETELTRGAAAKIIVSLMIGPDAANALPNTSSPYPDVPASHTFAGVISYCKTAKYISGYGDGTFKPAGTLTGYAFAKMLLGALGYSSEVEGFTGLGWTNNVAKIGNVAGLFDRISFDGAAAVTRDQACQLALNTLKATLVTYGGTTMINGTTGTYTMQGTVATPKTSNNRDINANIGRKDWYGGNNQGSDYLTLEFGEEHFKDLRLEHDKYDPAHDQFGRPSNEWSYKKVTIGTFPLAADYTYTTQVAHKEDTDGTKEKALGLRNFDLVADGGYSVWKGWGNTGDVVAGEHGTTDLWLNGLEQDEYFVSTNTVKHKVADIADFTDNGTLVEVYVSAVDADWITDVVVIQTQLMNVKKIGSDYVSLERYEDPDAAKNGSPRGEANIGFNLAPIEVNVEQVKDSNEECYDILKGLKSGDDVAVIPVTTDDGKTYEAAEVYVPETVSGALTRVDTYGIGSSKNDERGAVSITVGGTAYKIADWNDEMWSLKTEDIKATRKDVTLLMDKYGNALLAKDVGATNDFMVIGNFYQALAGNKICTFVHGWDISGNEVDLNLGSSIKVRQHGDTQSVDNHVLGELVYYTSEGANGDADYVLRHVSAKGDKLVRDVYTNLMKTGNEGKSVSDVQADYEIKASNLLLPVVTTLTDAEIKAGEKDTDNTYGESKSDYGRLNTKENGCGLANHDGDGTYASTWDTTNHIDRYYDKGVKFIYVNYVEGDDEIESVEFKSGVQNVSQDELRQAIMSWPSQAAIKDDQVKAVVIKRESNDASVNRMLYVTKTLGFKEYDKDTNESFYEVEVAMFNSDGKFVTEQHIIVNKDLEIGDFATYTKVSGTKYEDNYYRVKQFTRHNTNPAVLRTNVVSNVLSTVDNKMVKHLVRLGYFSDAKFVSNAYTLYNGDKLVGDIGDDGSDAEMYKESYVLGGYRGSSTTVPASIERANGVIRTDKAEWLNATRDSKWDDIDSAEDLFDKIYNDGVTVGNSTDVTKKDIVLDDIELNILLNEKPDSDGFRTAYLVVISKIGSKAPSVTDDPLNTTYNRKDNYSTSYVNTMRKGDKFSMTILNKNLAVDVANLHGVVVIDRPTVNADYWVFEVTEGTIRIPLYSTVTPPADTYTVTVMVDGKEDTTLSQTGLKDGAVYNQEYTVPTGKIATFEGKEYAAGEKIALTATINKANVTFTITLKDAEPADNEVADPTVTNEKTYKAADEIKAEDFTTDIGTVKEINTDATTSENPVVKVTVTAPEGKVFASNKASEITVDVTVKFEDEPAGDVAVTLTGVEGQEVLFQTINADNTYTEIGTYKVGDTVNLTIGAKVRATAVAAGYYANVTGDDGRHTSAFTVSADIKIDVYETDGTKYEQVISMDGSPLIVSIPQPKAARASFSNTLTARAISYADEETGYVKIVVSEDVYVLAQEVDYYGQAALSPKMENIPEGAMDALLDAMNNDFDSLVFETIDEETFNKGYEDTPAPTVTITAEPNRTFTTGDAISEATVTVTVTGAENYTVEFDPATMPEGEENVTVTVTVKDAEGNVLGTKTFTAVREGVAPPTEVEDATVELKDGVTFTVGTAYAEDNFTVTRPEGSTIAFAPEAPETVGENEVKVTVTAPEGSVFATSKEATMEFTLKITAEADPMADVIEELTITMTPEKPVAEQEEKVVFTASEGTVVASAEVDTSKEDKKGQAIELTVTAPEGKTFAEIVTITGDEGAEYWTIYKKDLDRTDETTLTINVTVKVAAADSVPSGNLRNVGAGVTAGTLAKPTAMKVYTLDGKPAAEGDVKAAVERQLDNPNYKVTLTASGANYTAKVEDTLLGGSFNITVTNASTSLDVLKKVTIEGSEYNLAAGMSVKGLNSSALLNVADGVIGTAVTDTVSFPATGIGSYKDGTFVAGPALKAGVELKGAVALNAGALVGTLMIDGKEVDKTSTAIIEGTEVAVKYTSKKAGTATVLGAGSWGRVMMNEAVPAAKEEAARVQGVIGEVTTEAFAVKTTKVAGVETCTLTDAINLYRVYLDDTVLTNDTGDNDLWAANDTPTFTAPTGVTSYVDGNGDAITRNESGAAAGEIYDNAGAATYTVDVSQADEDANGNINIYSAVSVKDSDNDTFDSSVMKVYEKLNSAGDDVDAGSEVTTATGVTVRKGEEGAVYIKLEEFNTVLVSATSDVTVEAVVAPKQMTKGIYKVWSKGANIDETAVETGEFLKAEAGDTVATKITFASVTDGSFTASAAATVTTAEATGLHSFKTDGANTEFKVTHDDVSAVEILEEGTELPSGIIAELKNNVVTLKIGDDYVAPEANVAAKDYTIMIGSDNLIMKVVVKIALEAAA